MNKISETLFQAFENQNAPPQGPLDVMAAYKQLKGVHDCSKTLKTAFILPLYAYLYIPRFYHRAFESVRKNAFECLKEFDPKLKPEHLGFEPIPQSKEFYRATDLANQFLAPSSDNTENSTEMTPERLQNLNKIIKFLES